MSVGRLTLRDLTVVDGAVPPAAMSFEPGLNLVVGASDTGKSFIFQAIDFMLGAKGPLRRIPQAQAYVDVLLSIDSSLGAPLTLRRAFSGGDFAVLEYGDGRNAPPTGRRVLAAVHSKDPERSLSAYLLRLLGVGAREIRKNAAGAKQGLSFRHFCHIALIDEERIIRQGSPVLSGQYTTRTVEQGVFAFMLTGLDDSTVVEVETKQEREARLAIQEDVLSSLLEERQADLGVLKLESGRLDEEATRLDGAIEEATGVVITSQREIGELQAARQDLVAKGRFASSRLAFVDEQRQRLALLDDYYTTDRARLETLVQASRSFHTLPEGVCPLCHRPYDGAGAVVDHRDFEAACSSELEKIDRLRSDLALAISDLDAESSRLQSDIREFNSDISGIGRRLEEALAPAVATNQSRLEDLVRTRSTIAQGLALKSTLDDLIKRLADIKALRQARPAKQTFEKRTTTSSASDLCGVIEEILTAWKYPMLGRVTYDSEKGDFVINGQDRSNKGKGYRALTYAAFVIGLMRYCRQKGFPHPGFVVLDTPLNPFKGPSGSTDGESLTDEVKSAVFRDLADDRSGDQIIIMENEEPPADVRERVNFVRFTKNEAVGRYGFFPIQA